MRAAPAFLFKVAAPHDAASGATPVIRMLAVAARGRPEVYDSWSLVHEDLLGTVKGWGQTGSLADGTGPDVLHALQDAQLAASGVTTTYSNAAGGFVIDRKSTRLNSSH